MSARDEEPYSTIFASLKHPIRRRILRMLSKKSMSFSEIIEVLGVSNSFLTYHLDNLGELISKTEDGKYVLSSFGEAANATMSKVEDIPTTAAQQLPRTIARKVIARNVTFALGIVCILLIASLGVAWVYHTNLQDQNRRLQTWLNGNVTLLDQTEANNTNLQTQITCLNSTLTNMQKEISNLYIASTGNSAIWVNNVTFGTENSTVLVNNESIEFWQAHFWGEYASVAGYVSVGVSSNDNSTYVTWQTSNASNTNYTFPQMMPYTSWQSITVGFGGTVLFPVTLNSEILISVGNHSDAKTTVTITYYY